MLKRLSKWEIENLIHSNSIIAAAYNAFIEKHPLRKKCIVDMWSHISWDDRHPSYGYVKYESNYKTETFCLEVE